MLTSLSTIWNSIDLLGRWLTLCTYVGIVCTLLATACGLFGYRISQRRDALKDQEAVKQDTVRVHEISSLKEENRKALEHVAQLQKRSMKIGVMRLSLKAIGTLESRQDGGFGTYAGHLTCTIAIPGKEHLIFTAEEFQLLDETTSQVAQAILDFEGPNISGRDIPTLDGVSELTCDLSSSYGSSFTKQSRTYNIDLLLNGIRIPLVQAQKSKGMTEGFKSVLGTFAIPHADRLISARYEAIMSNTDQDTN